MYIPEDFKVTDRERIFSFIEANAFGQLISSVNGRLFSTHLPFLVSDDRDKLICHMAKQNSQWNDIDGQEVLVTLQGAHEYVSPSWYSTPGVPTWNYQTVHLYGTCRSFHEPDKIKSVIDHLTERYESTMEQPWQGHYKASILKGIVGLEIAITEIQCKFKLNQNRSVRDQTLVAEQFKASGALQLASEMIRKQR